METVENTVHLALGYLRTVRLESTRLERPVDFAQRARSIIRPIYTISFRLLRNGRLAINRWPGRKPSDWILARNVISSLRLTISIVWDLNNRLLHFEFGNRTERGEKKILYIIASYVKIKYTRRIYLLSFNTTSFESTHWLLQSVTFYTFIMHPHRNDNNAKT